MYEDIYLPVSHNIYLGKPQKPQKQLSQNKQTNTPIIYRSKENEEPRLASAPGTQADDTQADDTQADDTQADDTQADTQAGIQAGIQVGIQAGSSVPRSRKRHLATTDRLGRAVTMGGGLM